jgi:hypothetical protein
VVASLLPLILTDDRLSLSRHSQPGFCFGLAVVLSGLLVAEPLFISKKVPESHGIIKAGCYFFTFKHRAT